MRRPCRVFSKGISVDSLDGADLGMHLLSIPFLTGVFKRTAAYFKLKKLDSIRYFFLFIFHTADCRARHGHAWPYQFSFSMCVSWYRPFRYIFHDLDHLLFQHVVGYSSSTVQSWYSCHWIFVSGSLITLLIISKRHSFLTRYISNVIKGAIPKGGRQLRLVSSHRQKWLALVLIYERFSSDHLLSPLFSIYLSHFLGPNIEFRPFSTTK